MFCSNCGQQLADGSKFCNKCGSPVAAPETSGVSAASTGVPQPAAPSSNIPPADSGQGNTPAPQQTPGSITTASQAPDNTPAMQQAPGTSTSSQAAAGSPTSPKPPRTANEKKLIILIACVSAVAVICLITLIVVLVSRSGSSEDKKGDVAQIEDTSPDDEPEIYDPEPDPVPKKKRIPGSSPEPTGDPDPTDVPEPTDAPEPTDVPEPTPTPIVPPEETLTGKDLSDYIYSVSTDDFPEFETFAWFTDDILQDITRASVNQDADLFADAFARMHGSGTDIKDVHMWDGGWMALIVWDPANANGKNVWELYNFRFKTKEDYSSSSLRIRSYKMYDPMENKLSDTSGYDDVNLTGTSTGTSLDFGEITVNRSWFRASHQYAFGVATLDDGTDGFVILMRP